MYKLEALGNALVSVALPYGRGSEWEDRRKFEEVRAVYFLRLAFNTTWTSSFLGLKKRHNTRPA